MLHVAFCTFHAARCMLHVACSKLHVACSMLHVACCTLHATCCTLHVACCTLHATCCTLHVARCTLPIVSFYVACVHRIVRKPQVERRSPAECSHRLSSPSCRTARAHRAAVPLSTVALLIHALGRCEAAANLRRSVRMCERMRAGLDTPATPASTHAHHRLPRGDTDLSERASLLWSSWQGRAQEYLAKVSSSESAPGAHEPILKMDTASSVTSCTTKRTRRGGCARVP
jgi:hypothetical protein